MAIEIYEDDVTKDWLHDLFSNQEFGEVASFYSASDYQGWTVKKEHGFLISTRNDGFVTHIVETLDETTQSILKLDADSVMFEQRRSQT